MPIGGCGFEVDREWASCERKVVGADLRSGLGGIQAGHKVDTRRGDTSAMQPVAIALCAFASNANSDLLLKLVETRQSTIDDRQFTDINALCEYGRATTATLLCLQMDAFARPSRSVFLPPAYKVAKDVGAAYVVANILRETHPLLARGIVILPADVMSLNGATPDSIYEK